jgi:hydroxysqualene dehydroxylase
MSGISTPPSVSPPTAHIIGAGLAGLASALTAVDRGYAVRVYEAAPQAGGRCRSFHDSHLNCVLDNGTHLVLGCNTSVFDYLHRIGASEQLRCVGEGFPMLDVASGCRWQLGWGWPRVPGVRRRELLAALWRLWRAGDTATISVLRPASERLFIMLWQPLCEAILNTPPEQASLVLLRRTLWRIARSGRRGLRPWLPVTSLSDTFVDPAVATVTRQGGVFQFGTRLKGLSADTDGTRIAELVLTTGSIAVADQDVVVLAVPLQVQVQLLAALAARAETDDKAAGVVSARAAALPPSLSPGLSSPGVLPHGLSPIVNLHFHLPQHHAYVENLSQVPVAEGQNPKQHNAAQCAGGNITKNTLMCGLSSGLAHWVFRKGDVLAVTISAATPAAVVFGNSPAGVQQVWDEVRQALHLPADTPVPPVRMITEKHATPLQTPAFANNRPAARTPWHNLWLAGDGTATGLPCTIAGALHSGLGLPLPCAQRSIAAQT